MRLQKDITAILRSNPGRVFRTMDLWHKLPIEHASIDDVEKAIGRLVEAGQVGTMRGVDGVDVFQHNDGSYANGTGKAAAAELRQRGVV